MSSGEWWRIRIIRADFGCMFYSPHRYENDSALIHR